MTYAATNRAELIRRLEEFTSGFTDHMKEAAVPPARYWSGHLIYREEKILLGILAYTGKKEHWTELAGWPYPGVKRWWVLENGALCAEVKFDYFGGITGRHLGSRWETRYYLPRDLQTCELQALVSRIA